MNSNKRKLYNVYDNNLDVEHISENDKNLSLIASTNKHDIYCVTIKANNSNVVLKVLKQQQQANLNTNNIDTKSLDNELSIGHKINHPSFRSSIIPTNTKIFDNTRHASILEYVKGNPIDAIDSINSFTNNIKKFLIVAREITSSLLHLHTYCHIMHLNLSCDHILYDPESSSSEDTDTDNTHSSIKIIGYSSAKTFSSKMRRASYITDYKELFDKYDLRYISPEQTGRIHHIHDATIDYRSDFYSLGIVFYKLLTNKFPFDCEKQNNNNNDDNDDNDHYINLIHSHILQEPVPISSINTKVPKILSDLILKLLNKSPDDRYQSCKGIIYDIDLLLSEYDDQNKLGKSLEPSKIILAQHDVPHIFLIPQKLYGRSIEYNTLLSIFETITLDSSEVVVITGDAGTGKSTLASELHKAIIQKGSIFIRGKYDSSTSKPYSAILETFKIFCDDLLLKDENTITCYKCQIQDAVGDEGILLTDCITNLDLIIGQQPSISDCYGLEAKSRFIYVFKKFIKALCSVGPSIVLLLDDLQWLDCESYELLSAILTDKSITNFMFIGTYRSDHNEGINERHHQVTKLYTKLKDANNNKNVVTEIKLENLDHEALNELISASFHTSPYETYPLTAYIHEKTGGGNPFFVHVALKTLNEEGIIYFCNDTCKWKWDVSIYNDCENSQENVLELLRRKIQSFDKRTEEVLKVASCIGSYFSLNILKLVVNSTQAIDDAISTGLIIPYKGKDHVFCFLHDQIQIATFSLLPEDNKPIFQYMGKKLLALMPKKELNDNIFVVVKLLLATINIMNDKDDRLQLAKLLLQAGEKAMSLTAFHRAFNYLNNGINLLGPDYWKTHYQLTLALHENTAKVAYCVTNDESMSKMIDEVSLNVTSSFHLVRSYALLIRRNNDKHQHEEAIGSAAVILEKLGEHIKTNNMPSRLLNTQTLVFASRDKFLAMKAMEDERAMSIMVILNEIIISTYYSNHEQYAIVSCLMVELTMEYGYCVHSAMGFCAFGSILSKKGDEAGYRFGKLGLLLLDKVKKKEYLPRVYTCFFTLISPFYASLRDTLSPFLRAYRTGLEIGQHQTTAVSAISFCNFSFFSGNCLENVKEFMDEYNSSEIEKSQFFFSFYQAVLNLMDENTEVPGCLIGDVFNCERCFDEGKEYDIARVSVICCVMSYLFHDYNAALQYAEICRPVANCLGLMYIYRIYLFYDSLISLYFARLYEQDTKWISKAKENISKLRPLVESAQINHQNKVMLLEAELAIVEQRHDQVVSCYQQAISLSNKQGFPNEEAISNERFGIYCLQQGSMQNATEHLVNAYKCYRVWGARSKMRFLTKTYPFISENLKNDKSSSASYFDLELQDRSQASVISDISSVSGKKKIPAKKRGKK